MPVAEPFPTPHGSPDATRASARPRGVPAATLLVLGVLGARVFYLAFLSGWELVGDEAHYWEWSRRLALSYYTKGPGIAWAIRAGTALFGNNAAAVRLPAALAAAAMAIGGARLARAATGGDERAAVFAAVALMLAPGYFATAQLATTDVFYAAAWMIAAASLFRAVAPTSTAASRVAAWAAVGGSIGVGCLFKYTALLQIPGIVLLLMIERRRIRRDRALAVGVALASLALLAACSPMIAWNAAHGWPTLAHQIGRLRLPGGDESVDWRWSPLWFPTFVGAQLALLGGVGGALVVMAASRSRRAGGPDPLARSLLIWLAVPILAFYAGLSVFRATQGNWAIAAFTTPLVLVGIEAADATRGVVRTAFRSLWVWYVGIGVVVAVVLLLGPSIARLPGISRIEGVRRVAARVSGASARARAIDEIADDVARPGVGAPIFIASNYQEGSLLAFYLPGQPTVYCAASRLGSRPNPYDFFADTDLSSPALVGRDAVLIGADAARWQRTFEFRSIAAVPDRPKTFVARGYAGPRADLAPASRPAERRTP